MTTQFQEIAVVGAGAWGSALAIASAASVGRVRLWARDGAQADAMNKTRKTPRLPGVSFPSNISITSDLNVVARADAVLLATPAQTSREVFVEVGRRLPSHAPAIICAKGLDDASGAFLSDLLVEHAPGTIPAVLSGPGFAGDVAAGAPTALTLACADEAIGAQLCAALSGPALRLYWSDDLIGVQLGGAAKNVLAIACGVVEGAGLGDSARAALIARGFAEIRRLALAIGARPDTLSGLSGLGDVVLTCTSLRSRNMAFGAALGRGATLKAAAAEARGVVEGAKTADALMRLAERHNVDMPISASVAAIVNDELSIEDAIAALLARPLKPELSDGGV